MRHDELLCFNKILASMYKNFCNFLIVVANLEAATLMANSVPGISNDASRQLFRIM